MEKHHGCLNTKVIIDYFQEHFPELTPALLQDLHPEINALDNPLEFLTDINNWVSSDVVIGLFKNARRLTQDDQIAFKIGSYAATHAEIRLCAAHHHPGLWQPTAGLEENSGHQ